MYIERRLVTYCALLIATIYYLFGKAEAATLQLEPVSIRLTPTARSAVLQLRNSGAEAMHVQVRAFRWHQAGGEDRLENTDELRISPPIQVIPPGGEQFVRILLAEELSPQTEQTFRLIVDELPGAPAADGHVKMLIRYSVPVTLRPSGLAPPALKFRLHQEPDGAVLEARNLGGQGAQLAELRLTTTSGATIQLNTGLLGYVLAGQVRRWPLSLPAGAPVEQATGITAQVDGKPGSYALEVAR
ncbi:MAG: fimbrial biogenesis chaperone [Steroidobacteraceae bacterium]